MIRLLGLSALAGLLFILAAPNSLALADDPVAGQIVEVDDSQFPDVRVVLTLSDASGRPLSGMQASAFTAQETGEQARVESLQTVVDQGIGVAVVLTLDTSGSMYTGGAIDQAKSAAGSFIDGLQPVDQAAVINFSTGVTVQAGFTGDAGALKAAVGRLEARGDTALYTAVARSIEEAGKAPLARRAIVLLSDGQDFGGLSTISRDDSLALAAQARVPVYAIGEGPNIDKPYLQQLASVSGGAFLEAPGPSDIPGVYNQLAQLFRSQYVLTVRSAGPELAKQRSVVIDVKTAAGTKELRADYQTRRQLPDATPTVEPTPVPEPATTESGGSNVGIILAVLFGGLGVVVAGSYVYSKARSQHVAEEIDTLSSRAGEIGLPVAGTAAPVEEKRYTLRVEGGSAPEATYSVGTEPMTIGSGPRCKIRLEGTPGIAEEQARVSVRAGKLVFHQLAKTPPAIIQGKPVQWANLEAGEVVELGPVKLKVEE